MLKGVFFKLTVGATSMMMSRERHCHVKNMSSNDPDLIDRRFGKIRTNEQKSL
jgi:hypothetical protein